MNTVNAAINLPGFVKSDTVCLFHGPGPNNLFNARTMNEYLVSDCKPCAV